MNGDGRGASRGGYGGGRNGSGRGRPGRFVHFETKVWHDPLLFHRNRDGSGEPAVTDGLANGAAAPFAAGVDEAPAPKRAARIIAGPKPTTDPRELERQRLLARLLAAEGRPSISRAVDDYIAGGFELPRTQEVWLQLLEHRDESKVGGAIDALRAILQEAPPQRRAVLESRLRSIEELADEPATRQNAAELRRFLNARYAQD